MLNRQVRRVMRTMEVNDEGRDVQWAGKDQRRENQENAERSASTGIVGGERITSVFHIAQEMGSPLNVVLGRMEYLLGRDTDRETARSLKAIMSQAQQLVALCQQLLDETCVGLAVTEVGSGRSVLPVG